MRLTVLAAVGLLALMPGCKNNDQNADAAIEAGPEPDTAPPNNDGSPCATDDECTSKVCYLKVCRTACPSGQSSCGTDEDCGSDDGKHPAFCYKRSYAQSIGQSCAVTGECPPNMECFGGQVPADSASAYCAAPCRDSTGCPPTMYCREFEDSSAPGGKRNFCVQRDFCGRCVTDGQCPAGGKCVKQGAESFCTVPCHEGSTECPRTADCRDVGGGNFQCVNRNGCVGDGKMCAPCLDEKDCATNSLCLTYNFSKESFCSPTCSSKDQVCEGNNSYHCQSILDGLYCAPWNADETKEVFCNPLTPSMEVGAVMPDFAVVGWADDNKNNTITDESAGTPKVVKLSDFSSAKLILFNVAAGWCGPCMLETTGMKDLMTKYRANGLMIFQVLFDGNEPGTTPTRGFLRNWIIGKVNIGTEAVPKVVGLDPQGACGIDPEMNVTVFNTEGTTPLNMLLDGSTRRVIAKWNALAPKGYDTTEDAIRHYLGLPPLIKPDGGVPKDSGAPKDAGFDIKPGG